MSTRGYSVARVAEYRAQNLQAALLVLTDVEMHGGPDSLYVQWAERVVRGEQLTLHGMETAT